jgi:hypothetical protein
MSGMTVLIVLIVLMLGTPEILPIYDVDRRRHDAAFSLPRK